MACRTVMPQRKGRIRSAGILTASRHIAVLPRELISFQYMAPGLAVAVRIPAAQERVIRIIRCAGSLGKPKGGRL